MFSYVYWRWQVVTPDGRVLEEFKDKDGAITFAKNNYDFLKKIATIKVQNLTIVTSKPSQFIKELNELCNKFAKDPNEDVFFTWEQD
jgi:hypothetical protein